MQTQIITINMRYGPDKRKLEKLLKKGWVIASQSTRGALSWKPGQVDFVLTHD